ncbi:MAG: hypothetical protein H7836_09190 [Magnetococcus sp. YQC-3]
MIDLDSCKDDTQELKQLFNAAEGLIKKAEHYQVGLGIPAINELRYAGQHMLRALTGVDQSEDSDPDDANDESEWVSAKKHCQRAQYDAAEGPVLFFLEQILDFKEDYRNEVISDLIPDYVRLMKEVHEINQQLQGVAKGSRQQYAETISRHADRLAEIVSMLPHAREELNKRAASRDEDKKYRDKSFNIAVWSVVIAVASPVMTALTFLK